MISKEKQKSTLAKTNTVQNLAKGLEINSNPVWTSCQMSEKTKNTDYGD